MEMDEIMVSVARQAEENAAGRTFGDYTGPEGLLYCGRCHTPKQYRTYAAILRREMTVPSLCRCGQEALRKKKEERKKEDALREARRLKSICIHDRALLDSTFEKDDGSLSQICSAKRYVSTWPERKEKNDGLLLWGGVGTGKTFYAACIANALIDRDVSVLMTNFAKILNQLSGLYSDERNAFIRNLMQYDLLIIDDLGIERSSEYAMEQVFQVIDERYKTNKPLIVTTNLSLNTLKDPSDLDHQRIYDRILSMCIPVSFSGSNHREEDRKRRKKDGEDFLREEWTREKNSRERSDSNSR